MAGWLELDNSPEQLNTQGFPMEDCTWEPEENVSCPELVAEYERNHQQMVRAKSISTEPRVVKKKEPHEIIGGSAQTGEITYLLKYKDGSAEMVPAKEANIK